MSEGYGIVVFSHLRWSFVWQRPQQFLSRFAERHPVLFIEEPDFTLEEGQGPKFVLQKVAPNVTTAHLALPASRWGKPETADLQRELAQRAIRTLNEEGAFDNPLLWYYSPMEALWAMDRIEGRGVVYDCMDELSQFVGAPPELLECERQVMERADVMFTGGYELWMKKSQQHPNVHFFGCGVEFEHFSKAQDTSLPVPVDVRDLKRPIIGWFGVVDERVDYDLLRRIAEMRPEWSFVLVGPVVKVDPATLPQAPNIHWLGGRDYKVLPDYCRAYDVCMMPFALNEATQYINPTKALEYLATAKPVVGTPVADVVRGYSGIVDIAGTPEEFVAAIERALTSPNEEAIRQGVEKARDAGWECTVAKMQDLIDEAVTVPSSSPAYMS